MTFSGDQGPSIIDSHILPYFFVQVCSNRQDDRREGEVIHQHL